MSKTNTNAGAPFQVLAWDGKIPGVTNSYTEESEAMEEASRLKALFPDNDYFVCAGDEGVAQKSAELQGIAREILTDNSPENTVELPAEDAAKSSAKSSKK